LRPDDLARASFTALSDDTKQVLTGRSPHPFLTLGAGVTRLCPTTTRCPNNLLAAQKVRVVLAEMRNNVLSNYEKVKIQITGHESKKILRLQLEKNDGAEGI
jgi:hypothetical protein